MLSLPPMRMLSHPLRSSFLFPLSWLPPLPRCPPPPCLLHSPSSLLVWLPRPVWLCCSSPCPLALLGAPCAHHLLSHPPAPPRKDFESPHNVDCLVCGWLVTPPGTQGAAPALAEFAGTSWREGGPLGPGFRTHHSDPPDSPPQYPSLKKWDKWEHLHVCTAITALQY